MLYAKIVLGIPVEGPFDYIVPESFSRKIKAGMRVKVDFRASKMTGYVVGLAKKTRIRNLKTISELIDGFPLLDKNMLLLARELTDYYCCSLGEAIETALPEALRKGRGIAMEGQSPFLGMKSSIKTENKPKSSIILLHDLDGEARWDIYLKEIKETLDNNRQIIVLLPDIDSVLRAKERLITNLGVEPELLYRKQRREAEQWLKVKLGRVNIVVGTRSAIFAPFNNLGLVIVDEEQNAVYKQEQVPHYHARVAAFMRIKIENAKLVLGSASPSLESLYLARQNKIGHIVVPEKKAFPEIKIIDTSYAHLGFKQKGVFSKFLLDTLASILQLGKSKILLFLNRKGFATFVSCQHCDTILRCPRCNINLVYHFKDNKLNCHYCNFKTEPPKICPHCNSGYIRYSGTGTEKIESELSRLFPQARIMLAERRTQMNIDDADIFISTGSIIKEKNLHFDFTGVLSIDNFLNRIDFRAAEKTFALLIGLLGLTEGKLVIQTNLPKHHCLRALENKDIKLFYDEELRQRRELNFPPYQHIGLVKLRGKNEERVKEAADALFKDLNKYNKNKNVKIASVNPGQPYKLRGKFWRQILIKAKSPYKITEFLKINLKKVSYSGIIVTVDIDPL